MACASLICDKQTVSGGQHAKMPAGMCYLRSSDCAMAKAANEDPPTQIAVEETCDRVETFMQRFYILVHPIWRQRPGRPLADDVVHCASIADGLTSCPGTCCSMCM